MLMACQRGHDGQPTANASLNAVPVHTRCGFIPDGSIVEKNDGSFLPMRLVIGDNGG